MADAVLARREDVHRIEHAKRLTRSEDGHRGRGNGDRREEAPPTDLRTAIAAGGGGLAVDPREDAPGQSRVHPLAGHTLVLVVDVEFRIRIGIQREHITSPAAIAPVV